jgi:hypothetical protein
MEKKYTHTQMPIAIKHVSKIGLRATINILNHLIMHVTQNWIM